MESAVAANTCGGLLYQPALPAHRAVTCCRSAIVGSLRNASADHRMGTTKTTSSQIQTPIRGNWNSLSLSRQGGPANARLAIRRTVFTLIASGAEPERLSVKPGNGNGHQPSSDTLRLNSQQIVSLHSVKCGPCSIIPTTPPSERIFNLTVPPAIVA